MTVRFNALQYLKKMDEKWKKAKTLKERRAIFYRVLKVYRKTLRILENPDLPVRDAIEIEANRDALREWLEDHDWILKGRR